VTSNAESHSHHSCREICCGLGPFARTRKLPEPARDECFGLLRDIPKKDFIWLTVDLGCHHCSRAQRREATAKTYRLARFKNLSMRAGAVHHKAFPFFFFAAAPPAVIASGTGRCFFCPLRCSEVVGAGNKKSLFPSPGRDRTRNYSTVPFGKLPAGDFAAGSGACSSTRRA
jgi:hypothetical protein